VFRYFISKSNGSEADAIIDKFTTDQEAARTRTTQVGALMGPKACVDIRGVFFAENSGLFTIYELLPLPADGLSISERNLHANKLEQQIAKLRDGFTINWWKIRSLAPSAEHLVALPEFLQNHQNIDDPKMRAEAMAAQPLLEALADSRRELLRGKRELHNRIFVALEYHGNFAFGGTDVRFINGLVAGWRALRANDPLKRREEFLRFKSILPGSETAITNIMHDRMLQDIEFLLNEGRHFFEILANEIKPNLVSQAYITRTTGLDYRQLGPEEAAFALQSLADKHPRRLANFTFPQQHWGRLGSLLVSTTVDFGALYGRRYANNTIGYPGQFAVGGMPRKIYSIRQLPSGKNGVVPGLLEFLDAMPYLITYRLRWHSLTSDATRSEITKLKRKIAETQIKLSNSTPSTDDVRIGEELQELQDSITDQQYGHLTILIDLAGWPNYDAHNQQISAAEDLEVACEQLEMKLRALDIIWAEEIDHQDVAFLSMFPGKVSFERLERLRCHASVFTALAPMHDSFQPEQKITEMDPKSPYLMTKNKSGRHELRSPISGKVCFTLVLGESGGGKSFFMNANAIGYKMADSRCQVDSIEAGVGLEISAIANGGAAIYVGDPSRPADLNPFDIDDIGPEGYDLATRNDLLLQIEAMIKRPNPSDQERAILDAGVTMLGRMPVLDGTGVRSVNSLALHLSGLGETGQMLSDALRDYRSDDSANVGRYSWVFPPVKNRAASGFVDYIFPVQTKDARAEALHFFSILQQFRRRANGLHPHLLQLDEANRFLNVNVADEYLRATALGLSKILSDILTQGRKLNLGLVICTQFATHLNNWDRSLRENLRDSLGTWIILPMRDESINDLQILVAKEASIHEPEAVRLQREGEANRQIQPIIEAAKRISAADYEFVWVKQGMAQILRIDEGWVGQAMFETGGAAMAVKRIIQDKYPGTQLAKIKAFEKALRNVRAGKLEWTDIAKALKDGTWQLD
jgi:hypothetical protein